MTMPARRKRKGRYAFCYAWRGVRSRVWNVGVPTVVLPWNHRGDECF